MEAYKKLCRELIEQEISEVMEYDKTKTRDDVLNDLLDDTGNVFGNIDGSRTCSTYEAEQFLQSSGALFDDEIKDLFLQISDTYFGETLTRGPETLDVVILELLAPQVISEMQLEQVG